MMKGLIQNNFVREKKMMKSYFMVQVVHELVLGRVCSIVQSITSSLPPAQLNCFLL